MMISRSAATNNVFRPCSRVGPCSPSLRRPLTNTLARNTVARVSQVDQESFEADVLKEYKGTIKVVKVEHDANPKLIEQFKVYGLPALILIKDGQLVAGSKREGAITKALLKDWLSKNGIPAPA